jgi:hypothetical protein
MSIGIVTSVYGEAYHDFLLPWSEAILDLNTDPDWITIAHDGVPENIRKKIDQRLDPIWITDNTYVNLHPQVHVNAAIAVTFTDWIIKADVDDLLLPHALDGWQESSADVVNFGYRIGQNDHVSRKVPGEIIAQKLDNPIGSCSPFRRWVWEMNEFRDLLFDDWCFWIEAAREGAIFDATERVDYIYTVHPQQMTRRHDNQFALAQIQAL